MEVQHACPGNDQKGNCSKDPAFRRLVGTVTLQLREMGFGRKLVYQSMKDAGQHALVASVFTHGGNRSDTTPASDKRFKQGTPDSRPMRAMHRGTSSESIDELAEGKRSRASSGQLPPANQRAGSNRVGAPKHATPTDDLTCKSFLKPTFYRRPPSSIAPIFVAMPAICSYYHRCTMAAAPFSHDFATMLFSLPEV